EVVLLLLMPVVTFLDLLRYLNGAQVAKTRQSMREKLRDAAEGRRVDAAVADPDSTEADSSADAAAAEDTEDGPRVVFMEEALREEDRKSTRLNSSHVKISYAVF